jgi:hypothetical protein
MKHLWLQHDVLWTNVCVLHVLCLGMQKRRGVRNDEKEKVRLQHVRSQQQQKQTQEADAS